MVSPKPVNQMEKESKKESNIQNKKKDERRYAGKNKMWHNTE